MSREKTAEFLVDCLSNMPDQPEQVQRVVNTAIDGFKMIAQGGEWPESEALAVARADGHRDNRYCAMTLRLNLWGVADQAEWAAYWAAYWAASWVASSSAQDRVPVKAAWAADWAAHAHGLDLNAAERARQARVREELGI